MNTLLCDTLGLADNTYPSTSAEASRYGGVSRYKLVVYVLLSASGRAYFCKSIAVEMGGVSRYFSKISGSGVDSTPLKR